MAQKPQHQHHPPQGKGPVVATDAFQCCDKEHHKGGEDTDPHRKGSRWSLTNMPPEISQYAIDAPVNYDAKAADIKKHNEDESKDIWQRTLLILQGTELSQKVFAGENLFPLILQDPERAFKEIFPAIEIEVKKNMDPEFHAAVANSIVKSVSNILTKNQQQARQLITLAGLMACSSNKEISNEWYNCFDGLVELLSSADLQREVIPHITERFGKANASVNAKRVGAKLIGKLAKKLPEEVITKRLYTTIENLCQDHDPHVRGTMVVRLPEVISKMKDMDKVLPILNGLLNDSDPKVMAALVGALGKTVTLMNPKDPNAITFFQTTIPIFKKFVKKAYMSGNTDLLAEFSSYMGPITSILGASGALSNGDKLWFLDAYLQLSRYGLPTAHIKSGKGNDQNMPTGFLNFRANMEFNRRHSLIEALISTGAPNVAQESATAATLALLKATNAKETSASGPNSSKQGVAGDRNSLNNKTFSERSDNEWACRANAAAGFPNFIKFAKPLVDFRHGLHPMVVDLMHDPVPAVRAKMAENIYAIMQHLGNEGYLLHGEVVYALSDDNTSVIEGIMPNLADMLKVFVQAKLISPDTMTNATIEIGGALLFCEERLSQTNDWRVHAKMLEQLAVLPFCLPGDHVYNNFVPALFHRLLHMRQLPCRIAAADAIVAFLRHCRRSHQREDIRKRIKEGFAQGRSVHDRMLFLFMSKKIMELFSRKYYRDHFFETTLAMTEDEIPNVRMKIINMLPTMKGVLQMSEDPGLLKKLEETLVKIKNSENDRDVMNAIEAVIPSMAKIGVVLKSEKRGEKTKEDLEDEAKEREEAYITSLEPTGNANAKEKRKSVFKVMKRVSEKKPLNTAPLPPAPTPLPPPPPPPPPPKNIQKEQPPPPPPPEIKIAVPVLTSAPAKLQRVNKKSIVLQLKK